MRGFFIALPDCIKEILVYSLLKVIMSDHWLLIEFCKYPVWVCGLPNYYFQ